MCSPNKSSFLGIALRNWDQFHTPRNVLLAMVGEVGEVAELFQWKEDVPVGLTDWKEKDVVHLGTVILNYQLFFFLLFLYEV